MRRQSVRTPSRVGKHTRVAGLVTHDLTSGLLRTQMQRVKSKVCFIFSPSKRSFKKCNVSWNSKNSNTRGRSKSTEELKKVVIQMKPLNTKQESNPNKEVYPKHRRTVNTAKRLN